MKLLDAETEPRAIALNLDTIGKQIDLLDEDFSTGVMLTIFSRCQPDNHCYLTVSEIADHIGQPEETVRRAIKCIQEANILKTVKDGDCMINPEYAFVGELTLQKELEYKAIA